MNFISKVLKYLGDNLEVKTVLWENPDPTVVFGSKNVTLSENIFEYEDILIEIKYALHIPTRLTYQSAPVTEGGIIPLEDSMSATSSGTLTKHDRVATIVSTNTINFSDAYYRAYLSTGDSILGNNFVIPTKIIGIKKLFKTD